MTKGYADDITMWVGVSSEGEVNGVMVRDMHETAGLGLRAFTDGEFFIQTMGAAGDLEVGTNADAITGATVTSRALVKGINSACAFVTGAEIESCLLYTSPRAGLRPQRSSLRGRAIAGVPAEPRRSPRHGGCSG